MSETTTSLLKKKYEEQIVQKLKAELQVSNQFQVPALEKITLSMGLGKATENPKIIDQAVQELRAISGQQPVVTRSKKSIATFKVREGQKIGAKVTLRGAKMWEFLERLINIALPRIRDFKGVSPRAFDGRGNFSLGLTEQIIFPEINYDKIDQVRGLNINITTTARTDEQGRLLLKHLGMPFRS